MMLDGFFRRRHISWPTSLGLARRWFRWEPGLNQCAPPPLEFAILCPHPPRAPSMPARVRAFLANLFGAARSSVPARTRRRLRVWERAL